MVRFNPVLLSLPLASAWPAVMEMVAESNMKRAVAGPPNPSGRPNTFLPPDGFNAEEQFVDVRPGTEHEYQRPGPGDHRGQCPGLNAAANHGFLPRSGLTTIQTTMDGLSGAYNMARSQGFLLSILSIALSGDIPSETWSIGGAFPGTLGSLLGSPDGIEGTHNAYEGDGSVISGDAYMNSGNVGHFEMDRWENLWSLGEQGYNPDVLGQHNQWTVARSVAYNPNYFADPLPGLIVIPGAHNFMAAFMSNHTAENPGGYLTRDHIKSFFGVTGDKPGEFKFDYGSQQIPQNWYKMPAGNAYTLEQTAGDALVQDALYPGSGRLGGNTGTTNSFVGVDPSDLSGGLFNAATLSKGNNALCFALQFTMAGSSSQGNVFGFLQKNLLEPLSGLGCPDFDHTKFNTSALAKFPGSKYKSATIFEEPNSGTFTK